MCTWLYVKMWRYVDVYMVVCLDVEICRWLCVKKPICVDVECVGVATCRCVRFIYVYMLRFEDVIDVDMFMCSLCDLNMLRIVDVDICRY